MENSMDKDLEAMRINARSLGEQTGRKEKV